MTPFPVRIVNVRPKSNFIAACDAAVARLERMERMATKSIGRARLTTKAGKTKIEAQPAYRSVSQKIAAKKNPKHRYRRGV